MAASSSVDEPGSPRSPRRWARLTVPAVALAATAWYARAASPRASRTAPRAAAAALVDTARGRPVGAALADDWSYSYLYDCTDGKPSVPAAYANGSWGSIAGEWYVVGGKFAGSSGAAGDCCRMKFTLPGGGMNQFMMYNNDDAGATTYYFWNYTDNVEYRDEAGVWWNSGETASDGHVAYKNFWSSVWAVGAYGGHRYFGWYECGKEVATTEAGIPWVLADGRDLHSDDGFVAMIEAEMSRLGLLASGNFTTYRQPDDCDYTWHHVKVDEGGF